MRRAPYLLSCGLAILFMLLWAAPLALAQVTLTVNSPSASAAPGEFVTLVYAIKNTGPASATFQFALTLSDGLSSLGTPAPEMLAAGASNSLFVTVLVTSRAQAGKNQVTLTASSTADPSLRASATAIITVRGVPGITLTAPPDREADPGQSVPLVFQISNRGNALDRLVLTASSSRGFPLKLAVSSLELLPAEEQPILVTVVVPAQARPGRDRISLEARSTVFSQVSASATVILTVRPPGPSGVGGTLFLTAPSQAKLTIQGQTPGSFTPLVSLSGGTDFQPNSQVGYRLQIANLLELRQLFFELDRPSFAVTLGDLVLNLSNLVQLSGRGARLTSRQKLLNTQLTVAAVQDKARFQAGAQLVFDPLPLLTLALQSRFGAGPGGPDFLGGLSLDEHGISLAQLRGELAFSQANGVGDQALLLRSTSQIAGLQIQAELVRAGSNFIGQRQDEAGLSLTQSFDTSAVRISSLFSLSHDNVNGDPTLPTLTTTQAQAAARLTLGQFLPTVSAMIGQVRHKSAGPPPQTDLTQFDLSLRLSQPVGPLELSLLSTQTRTTDQVAHTDLQELRFGSDADLRLGPLLSLFRVTQVSQFDLTSGALLSRQVEAFVSLTLQQPGRTLGFSVDRFNQVTLLSGRLSVDLAQFTVSSSGRLQIPDAGPLTLSLNISTVLNFDLPLPFIAIKGRVEGYVFIDENGNGRRDPGEPGVPNLILSLDGAQARTDPQGSGLYRFFPLPPGNYALRINNLPAELRSLVDMPIPIKLKAGETRQVDIPLARVAAIRGTVFNDADRNGHQEKNESGMAGVRLILAGPQRQTSTQVSGTDGSFLFADLAPGDYQLSLDLTTLPPRFEPTTPTQQTVSLKAGQTIRVSFGIAQRALTIKFSPTANFSFTPEQPTVGQTVRFDSSSSFDPDGRIVKYEWTFGDGSQAGGKIVEHTFASSGQFQVTLTVTDNDGNTGDKTKTVKVSTP